MNLRSHIAAATLALTCAVPALAAGVTSSESVRRELPIYVGGSLILENTAGDIDVVGTDDNKVVISAEKNVTALDKAALDEGRDATQLALLGDQRRVQIKTIVPPIHSGKWASGMRYIVQVPRTVHLKIVSTSVSRIHIAGMRGNVVVKSVSGIVTLDAITGPVAVESANSNIILNAPPRGLSNTLLSTVNGSIEVRAPASLRFQWVAQTLKSEPRTTFTAVNGAFVANTFRGSVNGLGGPTVTTQTFNGNVAVLQNGTKVAAAQSVRDLVASDVPRGGVASALEAVNVQLSSVRGRYEVRIPLGNLSIGEIHGNADITMGAGEVRIGTVFGSCDLTSNGGPLSLGQVMGALSAHTEAGDVEVQSARDGGLISTGGGIIRLNSSAGRPMKLQSGGGDIFVRQTTAAINAETQSGDITITVDFASSTERITAKTAKGNVILNVAPAFAAEIDATVITSDPDVNSIVSDLAGLQVRREQIGGKTKIRATGKVNGGGDRVELYAEDGGIRISTRAGAPAGSP